MANTITILTNDLAELERQAQLLITDLGNAKDGVRDLGDEWQKLDADLSVIGVSLQSINKDAATFDTTLANLGVAMAGGVAATTALHNTFASTFAGMTKASGLATKNLQDVKDALDNLANAPMPKPRRRKPAGGGGPGVSPQQAERSSRVFADLASTIGGAASSIAGFKDGIMGVIGAASPLALKQITLSLQMFAMAVGEQLLPMVTSASVQIQKWAYDIRNLDPELKSTIATYAAWGGGLLALSGTLTVLGPVIRAVVGVGGAAIGATAGMLRFTGTLAGLATGANTANSSLNLLRGSITLLGVAALAAGAYLAYRGLTEQRDERERVKEHQATFQRKLTTGLTQAELGKHTPEFAGMESGEQASHGKKLYDQSEKEVARLSKESEALMKQWGPETLARFAPDTIHGAMNRGLNVNAWLGFHDEAIKAAKEYATINQQGEAAQQKSAELYKITTAAEKGQTFQAQFNKAPGSDLLKEPEKKDRPGFDYKVAAPTLPVAYRQIEDVRKQAQVSALQGDELERANKQRQYLNDIQVRAAGYLQKIAANTTPKDAAGAQTAKPKPVIIPAGGGG